MILTNFSLTPLFFLKYSSLFDYFYLFIKNVSNKNYIVSSKTNINCFFRCCLESIVQIPNRKIYVDRNEKKDRNLVLRFWIEGCRRNDENEILRRHCTWTRYRHCIKQVRRRLGCTPCWRKCLSAVSLSDWHKKRR